MLQKYYTDMGDTNKEMVQDVAKVLYRYGGDTNNQ